LEGGLYSIPFPSNVFVYSPTSAHLIGIKPGLHFLTSLAIQKLSAVPCRHCFARMKEFDYSPMDLVLLTQPTLHLSNEDDRSVDITLSTNEDSFNVLSVFHEWEGDVKDRVFEEDDRSSFGESHCCVTPGLLFPDLVSTSCSEAMDNEVVDEISTPFSTHPELKRKLSPSLSVLDNTKRSQAQEPFSDGQAEGCNN
jgi:hypothetical protein